MHGVDIFRALDEGRGRRKERLVKPHREREERIPVISTGMWIWGQGNRDYSLGLRVEGST